MNNVNLIGRLTRDAETKTFESGSSIANFTIAVEGYKSGDEKQVYYIPCVAWGQTGVLVAKHFRKGHRIGITGAIESRSYEDREGNKRTTVFVNVRSVDFLQEKDKTTPAPAPEAPKKKISPNVDEDGNEYEAPPW